MFSVSKTSPARTHCSLHSDQRQEESCSSAENSTSTPQHEVTHGEEYVSKAPDGGIRAWLSLLGSFCMLFCTFGLINCIGTFQNYYEEVLLRNLSPTTVSWIPSLQIFFAYLTNPVTGRLYDVYGPRYLVLVGSILQTFGMMMTSVSTQYYQILLAQGVCTSIGMSAIYVPATACIAGWFDKKRGIAYGIATSGSSLGGVIFPIMISRLIPRIGFPWAMRSSAFLVLGLLIIANLTIASRVPPDPRPVSKKILLGPFVDLKLMLVNVGFLLMTLGVFIPINTIAVESLQHGLSFTLSHYLIATMNAGSLFGRIFAGVIADIMGVYNTFISVSALAGVFVLALYIPATNSTAIFVFSVIFGFTSGAYIALVAPLVVKISPLQESGYRIGLLFFLSSTSGLVTNPIGQAIVAKWHGDYTGMKIYSGIMLLSGTGLVFFSRLIATDWRLNVVF